MLSGGRFSVGSGFPPARLKCALLALEVIKRINV